MKNLTARGKIVLLLMLLLIIGVVVYMIYQQVTARKVMVLSQQEAETPSGVQFVANKAQVALTPEQSESVSKKIALLKNTLPDAIDHAVPREIPKLIEAERQIRGADFSIVTDSKQPDKQVNIKEVAKPLESTPVTLNQYNVFAYQKIVRGINFYPKWRGRNPIGVSEVTVDISRKISEDGKYIGIIGGYDFDNKRAKIGLRLTF